MHKQSLSIPLAQQSVNETHMSTDLNIPNILWFPKWLFEVMLESEIWFISIDGDSQSSETWLLKFIKFMSMNCDSLTLVLLSTLFISWWIVWIRVDDVSSAICFGVFRSVDRCVSLKDCCAIGPDILYIINSYSYYS